MPATRGMGPFPLPATPAGPTLTSPTEATMDAPIQKHHREEIFSLNIDDLDIAELERRLEMAVAAAELEACISHKDCGCPVLASCGTYCK